MDKKEIINRAHSVASKEDLLALLNDLVKDEFGVDCAFSFSIKQLSYYSNPNNIRGRYHHFSIPKKNKKGVRPIDAPSKGLNNILYFLNIILKALYTPSDYAMGFTEGRSVVDNAIRHINQNYVFNTDLKDFFTSIEQPRVWARLQLPPFNFNKTVAGFIAGLCSIRVANEDGTFKYVLPQGAPTSPIITNAICDKLDHRLAGLARRFNLHYTRYADDITFSSMHNVYQEGGEFRAELKHIIEDQHFAMHGEEKTRLQKVGQRQEVTGIIVSTKLNTPRKYVKEIRNVLHIWERYGYNEAYGSFYPYYKGEKGHVKKGEPIMENVIYGKLQYLKMVKGEKDSVYASLQARYDKLTSPTTPDNGCKLDYLRAFSLSEFEGIVGNKIEYKISTNGSIYGTAAIGKTKTNIMITNAAKANLVKESVIEDESIKDVVKDIKYSIPVNSKPGFYIVLTSSNGSKPFWLMTYYDPTSNEIDDNGIDVTQILDVWEKDGIDNAMKMYEEIVLSNQKNNPQTTGWETNDRKVTYTPIDLSNFI